MNRSEDRKYKIRKAQYEIEALQHDLDQASISEKEATERLKKLMANTMCLDYVDSFLCDHIIKDIGTTGSVNKDFLEEILDIMIAGLKERKEHFQEYYMLGLDEEGVISIEDGER